MTTHTDTRRTPIRYWFTLAVIGVALGTAYAVLPGHAPQLPPCPTEASVSCYWDGDTMGNGMGRSYTVDADGTLTYTDRRWEGRSPEPCPQVHAYNAQGVEVPIREHTCTP